MIRCDKAEAILQARLNSEARLDRLIAVVFATGHKTCPHTNCGTWLLNTRERRCNAGCDRSRRLRPVAVGQRIANPKPVR